MLVKHLITTEMGTYYALKMLADTIVNYIILAMPLKRGK